MRAQRPTPTSPIPMESIPSGVKLPPQPPDDALSLRWGGSARGSAVSDLFHMRLLHASFGPA